MIKFYLLYLPYWIFVDYIFVRLNLTSGKQLRLIQSSCRSFIGVIVPYEISKVNFRVETKNSCLYVRRDLIN